MGPRIPLARFGAGGLGMESVRKDLPPLVWLWFPPLAAATVLAADYFEWPAICEVVLRRDREGGGVLEWGTVLILVPATVAGAASIPRLRGMARARLLRVWVALWALACLYFAGEEMSWGQWLFGWETPEVVRRFNDQGETNLHNVSNFLDQVPRAFVELFLFVGGLLLPLWRKVSGRGLDERGIWYWILPTHVGTVAAAVWTAAQLADWIEPEMACRLNDSEVREFYIAAFLTLYLGSIWHRTRGPRP